MAYDFLSISVFGIPFTEISQTFIEPIDGIDNGISQYDTSLGLEPRYRIRTDLSSRVGWLNPAWNESSDPKTVDVSFLHPFLHHIDDIEPSSDPRDF